MPPSALAAAPRRASISSVLAGRSDSRSPAFIEWLPTIADHRKYDLSDYGDLQAAARTL